MIFIKKLLTIINLLRFYQGNVNISRRKGGIAKTLCRRGIPAKSAKKNYIITSVSAQASLNIRCSNFSLP